MANPLRGEEVPDETAERWNKVGELRLENSAKVDRLEAMGVTFDLGLPRVEHFMRFLYDAGIVSADQRVEEALSWEKGLNDQLDESFQRIQEQVEAQRKEARAPKLLGPQGQVIGGPNRQQRRHGG